MDREENCERRRRRPTLIHTPVNSVWHSQSSKKLNWMATANAHAWCLIYMTSLYTISLLRWRGSTTTVHCSIILLNPKIGMRKRPRESCLPTKGFSDNSYKTNSKNSDYLLLITYIIRSTMIWSNLAGSILSMDLVLFIVLAPHAHEVLFILYLIH